MPARLLTLCSSWPHNKARASTAPCTPGNIGGKNAIIVTQADGAKSYGYTFGDTIYFLEDDVTEAQAAARSSLHFLRRTMAG